MRRSILSAACFVIAVATAAPLAARSLDSIGVNETEQVQAERPGWPIPSEPNQLLYFQRSTNSNTVIYVARFGPNGDLDPRNPVAVYWRRYNDDGARKALSFFESRLAFGVSTRRGSEPGHFIVTPRALSRIKLHLRQTGPGRAELLVPVAGRMMRPVYAFAEIDESGLIPRVTQITVHAIDPATGRAIAETFRVSGGEIPQ